MPIYTSRWFEVTDNSTDNSTECQPYKKTHVQYPEKSTLKIQHEKIPHEKIIDDIVARCISAK